MAKHVLINPLSALMCYTHICLFSFVYVCHKIRLPEKEPSNCIWCYRYSSRCCWSWAKSGISIPRITVLASALSRIVIDDCILDWN